MLRTASFIILLAVLALTASAQNSKITSAALELDAGNYEDAVKFAREGVSNPSTLKPKQVAKGYSIIARSLMGLYTRVSKLPKDKKEAGDAELKSKFPTLVEDAFDALNKAKEADPASVEDQNLMSSRLAVGQLLLIKAQDKIFAEKADLTGAVTTLDQAEVMFKDLKVETKFFVLYFLRGIAKASQDGDAMKLAAISDFEQTIAYHKNAVELAVKTLGDKDEEVTNLKTNPAPCRAYGELITLYAKYKKDLPKAKQLADQGSAACKGIKDGEDAVRIAELNLYLQNPSLFDEAFAKFESEIQKKPDDVEVLLAYAGLLEKKAKTDSAKPKEVQMESYNKAIDMYKKALAKKPDSEAANYNVGVIYNNFAAEVAEKINKLPDNAPATVENKLREEMKGHLRSALPYMEKASELTKHADGAILHTLVSITTNLEMMDKSAFYFEKQKALKNK